ncbi:class F sortase [Streptomyces sp. NPDC021224]|uniref:class F sortase n=1 Tax=unclassified Streptomyces TaxID=2593676 RepID=UPI00378D1CB8
MTLSAVRPAAALLLAALLLAGCANGTEPGTEPGANPAANPTAAARPAGTTAPPTAAPKAAAQLPRSTPTHLTIPSIGVDTPLTGLGLQADGTVEVPPVAAHAPAGWYRGSPTPGQLGPAVILGHVTVGAFGDGVFLRLSELKPGARVTVRRADGANAVFTVYAVRTVAKDRFPTGDVYGDTARPELRLITCGGPRTGSGYRDNVVVFASFDGAGAA